MQNGVSPLELGPTALLADMWFFCVITGFYEDLIHFFNV